jgi:hypothetical protein
MTFDHSFRGRFTSAQFFSVGQRWTNSKLILFFFGSALRLSLSLFFETLYDFVVSCQVLPFLWNLDHSTFQISNVTMDTTTQPDVSAILGKRPTSLILLTLPFHHPSHLLWILPSYFGRSRRISPHCCNQHQYKTFIMSFKLRLIFGAQASFNYKLLPSLPQVVQFFGQYMRFSGPSITPNGILLGTYGDKWTISATMY